MRPDTDGLRRRHLATLCVVGLLLVAGCGGAAGPDTANRTVADGTVTDGTTTETATPAVDSLPAAAFPPGVTAAGVQNETQLLGAHRQALVRTPGVIQTGTNATLLDRSFGTRTTTVATAGVDRLRYESRATGDLGDNQSRTETVVYANATNVTQRVTADGEVQLANTRQRTELFERALAGFATATNPIRGLLTRGDFRVANVTHQGETRVFTLRADSYTDSRLVAAENVTSYTATIQIAADGGVLAASERIEGREAADFGSYQFDYRFRPGEVSPEPFVPNATVGR